VEHQQTPREAKATNVTIPVGVIGLAIDVFVLTLPIVGVTKLQLPLHRKIGVMAVFLLGLMYV